MIEYQTSIVKINYTGSQNGDMEELRILMAAKEDEDSEEEFLLCHQLIQVQALNHKIRRPRYCMVKAIFSFTNSSTGAIA